MFADQVKSGALPPVEKRIPAAPSIVTRFATADGPGQPGGQFNMLISGARDTRLMTVYSNARLIVYDDQFKLQPDILESYEVEDGKVFTFKLRPGHKWSDGHPFTTEDFRFFWEDVANNNELSPSGPSVELLVDGKPPKVEIIDERTIRYSWDEPNPYFIETQAHAAPLFLFRPAHYLKKFHGKYTEPKRSPSRPRAHKGSRWVHDLPAHGRDVRQQQSRPAVAQPVGPHHGRRRRSASSSCAIPTIHRIDHKGGSCPTSTA